MRDQGRESGPCPDVGSSARREARRVPRYLIHHRHQPHECGIAFTSFKGHQSSLRHRPALVSCPSGGHEIWWTVDAETEKEALGPRGVPAAELAPRPA